MGTPRLCVDHKLSTPVLFISECWSICCLICREPSNYDENNVKSLEILYSSYKYKVWVIVIRISSMSNLIPNIGGVILRKDYVHKSAGRKSLLGFIQSPKSPHTPLVEVNQALWCLYGNILYILVELRAGPHLGSQPLSWRVNKTCIVITRQPSVPLWAPAHTKLTAAQMKLEPRVWHWDTGLPGDDNTHLL